MVLKIDAKFIRKVTCAFKNDMMNLEIASLRKLFTHV